MYFRTILNDILKSKAITLITVVFVAAAAMLVSLAAILVINLSGAIDTLMTKAMTPHFMQMHSGEIDLVYLETFAEQNNDIADYQVLEFLNLDSAQFVFEHGSLAGSVQDNGLTIQSEKFDFLLDLDGNVIEASDGEIYVPICYMQDGTAKIGDKVVIYGKELLIAGFLRDSQMNSLLASSKRFLVSKNDYAGFEDLGNPEYLIEFRLKDLSALSAFETAYVSAGLNANGPTITYPLFKTINAMSDGLMIAVILLVSVLVVTIAFLCIRFTLLAKIEDDYREIGVMKAIGLRVSDIKKMYLAKYTAIAATGSILGFLCSFLFRGILLENIRLYMGESDNSSFALIFGMISILLVFFAIIVYVNGLLKRFRKISPAEAIRFGKSQEKSSETQFFRLSNIKLLGTNIFLGAKDVFVRKKMYITMLTVLILSAFIIIIPENLYNTISSEKFVTYMGIGNSDLRIDIQQTDNIFQKAADIAKTMENDIALEKYVLLTTKTFSLKMDDGSEERIKVELGDHSVFPVTYSAGKAPLMENEIALSSLNADELGKRVGDEITLVIGGQEKILTVCGIYSDITNGGKTAKAAFDDNSAEIMWSIIYAELSEKSQVSEKIYEYAEKFDFAKVSGIDEYIVQTFSSTIAAIKKASYAAVLVALIITIMVTTLFMRMLIAKDRYPIAVMKAFGFTSSDIKAQYLSRSLFVLIIGVSLGTILANTLGEALAGAVISMFGASSFEFEINALYAYVLSPFLMTCSVLIATVIGTLDVGQVQISENIKE
jgi:putative ABC transport system permease protein